MRPVFRIPPEHPSLPGHFPGRPVAPGVLLLEQAFGAMLAGRSARVASLDSVRFAAPVLPGQTVEVDWEEREPRQLSFTCRVDGLTVLHGRARLADLLE